MKLVSNNTPEEVAYAKAAADLEIDLRQLTANLLRIVRGAGRPSDVPMQLMEVLDHYRALHKNAPDRSLPDVGAILRLPRADYVDEIQAGMQQAMRGGLQIAASRLLEQATQEAAGDEEMFAGIRRIEAVHEARRIARRRSQKAKSKSGEFASVPREADPSHPVPRI